jgi:hypothetical protein
MASADATTGIACQLLFCRREAGEILVDLLALDPLPVDGDVLVPGTPLTLGLTDPGAGEAGDALVALLDGWASRSSVCRVEAVQTEVGQRLCIAADGDRLVIDVDGRTGIG